MSETIPLTAMGIYHVRHAGPTAAQAADDIAGLLDLGVTLVDVSYHDRPADVVTLRAHLKESEQEA